MDSDCHRNQALILADYCFPVEIKVRDSVNYLAKVVTAVSFVIIVAVVADFLILLALATATHFALKNVIRKFPRFFPLRKTPRPLLLMVSCHEPIPNHRHRLPYAQAR